MDTTAREPAGRRKYKRRTDDEKIADLERRIVELKQKQAAREKKDDPVLREIPKLQRRLRKFAQLAMDHNRPDISNSTMAFIAGLEHTVRSETAPKPARTADDEDV